MYLSKTLQLLCILRFLFDIDGRSFVESRAESTQGHPAAKRVLDSDCSAMVRNILGDESEFLAAGKLEKLKQRESELSHLLAEVRMEKLSAIRSRPLSIGVIGFGRFGQFIARTFQKYGRVVVISRSDYTEIASNMGVKYVPLSNPRQFLEEDLDVIVVAVSILSFESTLKEFLPHLEEYIKKMKTDQNLDKIRGPLFVDVLSVKEHARELMLKLLPAECDILCTHPMFGPDSGKSSWRGLNFVYEKTRIDGVVLNRDDIELPHSSEEFIDEKGIKHSIHDDNEFHIEALDRIERFLSIWEEEGCRMISMKCKEHDSHAANSQFITHLMGRILGEQGLSNTPIDTTGFQSVLRLVDTTKADSFELFYGLYKYNQNSINTIRKLQLAMKSVMEDLKREEKARS